MVGDTLAAADVHLVLRERHTGRFDLKEPDLHDGPIIHPGCVHAGLVLPLNDAHAHAGELPGKEFDEVLEECDGFEARVVVARLPIIELEIIRREMFEMWLDGLKEHVRREVWLIFFFSREVLGCVEDEPSLWGLNLRPLAQGGYGRDDLEISAVIGDFVQLGIPEAWFGSPAFIVQEKGDVVEVKDEGVVVEFLVVHCERLRHLLVQSGSWLFILHYHFI